MSACAAEEEDAGGWSGWQELEIEPPPEPEAGGLVPAEGSDADDDASADEGELMTSPRCEILNQNAEQNLQRPNPLPVPPCEVAGV